MTLGRYEKGRTWRWRTVKPWPQLPRIAHPLAHRAGQPAQSCAVGAPATPCSSSRQLPDRRAWKDAR